MATTDRETTSPATISVATMSTVTIDLDTRAGLLPRQNGRPGDSSGR